MEPWQIQAIYDIPSASAFLVQAVWTRDTNWFWLAAGTACVEMGLEYRLHLERRVKIFRTIRREIFARYSHCDFRQVSMREYFADSPELFRELVTHLSGSWQASTRLGRKAEETSGEMIGVPHVMRVRPQSAGPGCHSGRENRPPLPQLAAAGCSMRIGDVGRLSFGRRGMIGIYALDHAVQT